MCKDNVRRTTTTIVINSRVTSIGMSEDDCRDIEALKRFLLKSNPSIINNDNQEEITSEFLKCFQDLFDYFDVKSECLPEDKRLLVTDTFSIWVLRTTQVLSNKKLDTSGYFKKVQDELTSDRSTTIYQYILDFWIDGNSAFINALKDLFNKFLHLIKRLYSATECNKLFASWLEKTLQVPSSLPVQYYLIDALAGELDLYTILEKRPDFIDNSLSLMWSDALSNPIGRCLSRFLINVFDIHFKKDPLAIPDWLALWQDLAMSHLSDSRKRRAIELYVLTPVFKGMPNIAFTAFVQNITTSNSLLFLSIIKIGQELGIEDEPFHEDRLLSLDTLKELLKQDDLKLCAFELLTSSAKKSMPVHSYVFPIVRDNLTPFFVDTEIETRNYFCSSFKHFLHRIRDSAYSSHKSAKSLEKANKFPNEQLDKLAYVEKCKKFIEQVLQFLKLQICPGTQYQRNDTAFKLLKVIVESGVDASIPKKYVDVKNARDYPFSVPIFDDESMIRLLFDCLASNYPDIRQMAKKSLFMAIDSSYGDFVQQSTDWRALEEKSMNFLKEYQYSDIGAVLQDVLYRTSEDKRLFISQKLDILHEKVLDSKRDFLKHIDQPISGYLTSINLILLENEFELTAIDSIVDKCISIVLDNWQAVSHVICHDSDEKDLHLMYPDGEIDAQLILSTAFRTTKESSMLLQTLIQRYPLAQERLIEIGDFLINQLFNIRHSGAFQSVSPTFLECCLRCRKENPKVLAKWLETVLKSLEIKTQNVTRRSGGIPSLLAVILATESKERPLLNHAFTVLMRIASTPIDEHQDKVDLPQVNAFNCIKTIFTESKLSDACEQYAAQALALSLTNFDSDIWALRNCSIMLFTSLQNRLFGKKGKSVSARLFFTRYRGVRENLLNVLKTSIMKGDTENDRELKNASRVESIFLVLSILSRLKPTPGYNGLQDFTAEILKCVESQNWGVRRMSAQVLSSLADDSLKISADFLETSSTKNQNRLHGCLLLAKEVIGRRTDEKDNQFYDNFIKLLVGKSDELLCKNTCFVTTNAYLSLMACILREDSNLRNTAAIKKFLSHLGNYFLHQDGLYAIDGSKQLCLSTAIKVLLEFGDSTTNIDVCELGILSPFYEVQKAALSWYANGTGVPPKGSINFSASISKLIQEKDILPSVGALALRALDASGENMNYETLIDIIESPASEEMQLVAIQCIGKYVPATKSESLIRIGSQFSRDALPTDFRLACFKCLSRYPYLSSNAKLLFDLHQMLSDDDEEVREIVANFLYSLFFPSHSSRASISPSVVGDSFGLHLLEICPLKDVQVNAVNRIKAFFVSGENGLLCSKIKTSTGAIFELEKDNQYRFELEQTLQYVNILQASSYEEEQFSAWLRLEQRKVTDFLSRNKIKDGPFGWASSGTVFSRLYVLKALITTFAPESVGEFESALKKASVHPVILASQH